MPRRKKDPLVRQHLENVSWKVMANYPHIIRDLIRGHPGVYALYKRDRLYYVGLASNLMGRLKTHLRDRHRGNWDRFSVYLTAERDHIKEIESVILRVAAPPGNRVRGKLPGSEALIRLVARSLKEEDEARRADILGGVAAKTHRQRVLKRGRRGAAKHVHDRRRVLKATCNGWEYRASLRRDGTISYDGEIYATPSGAAKAALGRNANGWSFWNYKDANGEWAPLRRLKK